MDDTISTAIIETIEQAQARMQGAGVHTIIARVCLIALGRSRQPHQSTSFAFRYVIVSYQHLTVCF